MLVRKLIAYGLIIAIVGGLAAWAWLHRRRILAERRRNHGPRQD